MLDNIEIVSINVRGLHTKHLKRKKYFHSFNLNKTPNVILLQETHSTIDDEMKWRREWGGDIIFAHGTSSARGVCILFKKTVNKEIHSIIVDTNGRFVMLDITLWEQRVTLVNLYGPNNDDPDFFLNVIGKIESCPNDNRIIGGDFNCILDPKKDKKGGNVEHPNVESRHTVQTYMTETDMVDIWRLQHSDSEMYTYHTNYPEKIFSRIDFFVISFGLVNCVKGSKIKPKFQSDHCPISITMMLNKNEKGPGFWKLNCSLLLDTAYTDIIKRTISDTVRNNNGADSLLLWDTVKLQVRGKTIQYASRRKRAQHNLLGALERRLMNLEQIYNQSPSPQIEQNINLIKNDIDEIITEKTKGMIIRSKAEWYEEGEKPTKYFLNLEKRNYNNKTISRLKLGDSFAEDKKHILSELQEFYQKLYSSKSDTEDTTKINEADQIFLRNDAPKLTDEEKATIEGLLSENEVLEALETYKEQNPGIRRITSRIL